MLGYIFQHLSNHTEIITINNVVNIMTKKKLYEAPESEMIKVLQESHLLDGSVTANRVNYTEDPEEDWEY